jgi:hypothetical protein
MKSAEILVVHIFHETTVSIFIIFHPNFELLKPAYLETSIMIAGTNQLYTSAQIKQPTKDGQGRS